MISVVMATYNGQQYIAQQLDSILLQLNPGDEIVIVDDCSSDETVQIILSYCDDRIKLTVNDKNVGVVSNFYKGLSIAAGDVIVLCDQDDVWFPNKVQHVTSKLKMCDVICHDCVVTDENLIPIFGSFFELRKSGKGIGKNFFKNSYVGCCMAFTREVLQAVLPGLNKAPMHDVWIGLIAELCGFSVDFSPEKCIFYRRHAGAVSETGRKDQRFLTWAKAVERVILFKNILVFLVRRNVWSRI